MGCSGSKMEDLKLVALCKERKDLIRAVSQHRYNLAAAHISYFRSLKDVGDALFRFVEEELVVGDTPSASSSSSASPVLTLPSDEGKGSRQTKKGIRGGTMNKKGLKGSGHGHSSSSTSISHSLSDDKPGHQLRGFEDDGEDHQDEGEMSDSHIHLSSDDAASNDGHIEIEYSPDPQVRGGGGGRGQGKKKKNQPSISPQPGISYVPSLPGMDYANLYNNPYYTSYEPYMSYSYPATNSYAYHMMKSSTPIPSLIYEEPKPTPIYHSNYALSSPMYANYGFTTNTAPPMLNSQQPQGQRRRQNPPTPPAPEVSAWDYLNPFEMLQTDSGYPGYYPQSGYEFVYGSNSSSPDLTEVREREGIPDLEDETESEASKDVYGEANKKKDLKEDIAGPNMNKHNKNVPFEEVRINGYSEGKSKGISPRHRHPRQRPVPLGQPQPVPFEQPQPVLYQHPQSVPTQDSWLLPHHQFYPQDQPQSPFQVMHGTWEEPPVDAKEVTASSSSLHSDDASVSVISGEDMYVKKKGVSFQMDEPNQQNFESSKPSSLTSLSANGTRDIKEVVMEIRNEFVAATDYGQEVSQLLEAGKMSYRPRRTFMKVSLGKLMCSSRQSVSALEPSSRLRVDKMARSHAVEENGLEANSLVSTLDKLYVWEKKLYKEVKDEEKLRMVYEKQCRKLKSLDEHGAETSKIESTQASIKQLLTKINVSLKVVDAIARRIHQLRDQELQPQLQNLVIGLRKMWRLMLKCHQNQFHAIVESKIRTLKANMGAHRDIRMRATVELEMELQKWCDRFNKWIDSQKSCIESLNEWLRKWLHYEEEETSDGPMPFSPGRLDAPLVFIICHDWKQAINRISKSGVQDAMNEFIANLHELRLRQEEELRQRLNAEYTLKNFQSQIQTLRVARVKTHHGHRHGYEEDASSDKGSMSIVQSDNASIALDDLKVGLDSIKQRVKEERAGHKEAIRVVHAAAMKSIQEGLVSILEALESFTSAAVKAYDDVRLDGAVDDDDDS